MLTNTTPTPLVPFFAIHDNDNYADGKRDPLPPLFATYTARDGTRSRVRCVTASKLGRIGITESLTDDAPVREFVPAGSLSQFMPTPYPQRRPPVKQVVGVIAARIHAEAKTEAAKIVAVISRCPVGIDGVVAQVTTACGLAVADIGGSGRAQLLTAARRMLFGKLAARHPELSSRDLHRLIGSHHTTALLCQRETGFHPSVTTEFDMPFLRALWLRGVAKIGNAPGDVPREVADRLGRFVTVIGRHVEPATWAALRHALAIDIAHKRIAAAREELKCAA